MMKICQWEESFLSPAKAFLLRVSKLRQKDRRTEGRTEGHDGAVSRALVCPTLHPTGTRDVQGGHSSVWAGLPHGSCTRREGDNPAMPQSCAHTPGCTTAHQAVPAWSARYAELIGLKEIAGSLITEPIERHVSA